MSNAAFRRAPALVATLAAATLWLGAAAPAVEPAAPAAAKAPASLEDQLKVLSSALVESFNTGDWEMLELVADGVKAAGLKGPDLEVFALTSERDAALGTGAGMGMWPDRNRILVWGLAFRAKLGSAQALTSLREKSQVKLTPVEYPKAGAGGVLNQEEYKAWSKYQAELGARNTALLALALLGEKDAGTTAWDIFQKSDAGGTMWGGMGPSPLVMAVLAAEGAAGWKQLSDYCSTPEGEKDEFGRRVSVLSSLASLANVDRPGNRSQVFRVEGKLAKTLPADAAATLRASFIKLAEKVPQGDSPNFSILFAAQSLPGLPDDAAALAALKGLKGRATGRSAGHWDKMIDRIINPPTAKAPAATTPGVGPGPQKETF